jgi:tetratricopeptide (TPR) repeat protein
MPPDGYTAICQCPLCKGKDTPERDYRGRLSDYVWDFVNRVAKEVAKTHPGKMVSNCAYGTYTLPPTKIEKLEPNVLVCIVGGRRPTASTPEQQEELRKLREAWAAKTANPIMIFENYPFTDRGWYMPSYVPRVIGSSINATKGMSQGEDIWLSAGRDFKTVGIGFNHFQVYFTARMYWGGKNQDVEAILDEYCRLFYGPAGPEMKAFFDYCESNWQQMNKDKERVDRALALFAAAEAKTTAETVYGKRIALVGAFLEALKNKSEQLARQRGPVPQLRLARDASGIVIDGDLNDKFWKNAPSHATGQLRELQTGRTPTYGTRFQAAWGTDGHLYLAIRCQDRKGEKLKIGTTRNGDQALWYGDAIEILLETEAHSYYQIAVSPSGAIVNLDRGADKSSWFRWDSQAEVATRIGEDHWTVEIRIPVTTDSNDPLHQVIGRKPSSSLPWHFNICRQRIRDTGQELSAFSPTGKANFHDPMKFAHLFEGKSHQFDHAPATADYLEGRRAALALLAKGKRAEALTAFTTLADGKLTPFQKADALEQAAACARLLQQPDRALALAEQIPEKAAAKLVRMQNLLAQRQPKELVEQFGSDDINQWPFWLAGDAYFARGRAFADTGAGREAEADFLQALEVTPGSRLRPDIWLALGLNREQTLKDDTAALEAYQEVTRSNARGSATYFRGVQSAARVFSRKGQHDEAVKLLKPQTTDTPRGFWRGSMWLALADAYKAAGRKAEAQELYQQLLKDDQVEPTHRKAAEAALKKASQPE